MATVRMQMLNGVVNRAYERPMSAFGNQLAKLYRVADLEAWGVTLQIRHIVSHRKLLPLGAPWQKEAAAA